jgi:hypothetical protein
VRKRRYGFVHVVGLAILGLVLGCTTAAVPSEKTEPAPLKQVADVPLSGPAVRFDYQSLDASHGRLYLAHMNADHLVVFDTKKREVVANLDGFPNVHGVWARFLSADSTITTRARSKLGRSSHRISRATPK